MKFAKRSTKNYTCYFSHSCQVSKIILVNGDLVWMKAVCLKNSTESRRLLKKLSSPIIELRSYVGMWSEMMWFSDNSTVLKIRNPCDSKCKHPQFIRSGRYLVLPVIITPSPSNQTLPHMPAQTTTSSRCEMDIKGFQTRTCYVCIMCIFLGFCHLIIFKQCVSSPVPAQSPWAWSYLPELLQSEHATWRGGWHHCNLHCQGSLLPAEQC